MLLLKALKIIKMKSSARKTLLMKGLVLPFLIFILCLTTFGQNFEWKTGFHGFFDNREYFNDYTDPQTIFGSRLFAEAGFALNDYNRFKAGLNFLYEFGSKGDLLAPVLNLICADVLGDSPCFTSHHVGVPDHIQQCGLAVVYMP